VVGGVMAAFPQESEIVAFLILAETSGGPAFQASQGAEALGSKGR
jgi:hypothetical protein